MSFINERLLNSVNYALNVNDLEGNKDFRTNFKLSFERARISTISSNKAAAYKHADSIGTAESK